MDRYNKNYDGTPIQQSMTVDRRDYRTLNLNRLMLGVVLEVYHSDDPNNKSSYHKEDGRGHLHLADVLIIDDGVGGTLFLKNVVVTPDGVTGLDDYSEHLPRASSQVAQAGSVNSALQQIDPNDLDGDQCVVGFLGGSLDRPFILRYWPHPRNVYDPATSGQGVPDEDGNAETLVQQGRYFRRINGVECTINESGDILFSTDLSGSGIAPGESATRGRFARRFPEAFGGSVRINIKPSQTFRLDWNPQEDGIGVNDLFDASVPQTNPPATEPSVTAEDESTVLDFDKDRVRLFTPVSVTVVTNGLLSFTTEGDSEHITRGNSEELVEGDKSSVVEGNYSVEVSSSTTITSGSVIELEAPQIKLGANASEPFIKGTTFTTPLTPMLISLAAWVTAVGAALAAATIPDPSGTLKPAVAGLTPVTSSLITQWASAVPTSLSVKVVGE